MKKLLSYVLPLAALFAITGALSAIAGVTPSSITSLRSPTLVFNGPSIGAQLLRIGETRSVPPSIAPGVQRPVGSFLYDPSGAFAYVKTNAGPQGWEQLVSGSITAGGTSYGQLVGRAVSLVGFGSALTCWREDFAATAPTAYATILAGTGTSAASANNDVGAHWLFTTGATAASRVRFGGQGNVIGRPDTARFYAAFRFAVTTAIDAQTSLAVGFTNNSIAGVQFGPGICGGVSTGFYVFGYDAQTLATCAGSTVTTTVAVSTVQHLWEVWGVGDTRLHFAADGVELGNSPVTQASAGTNSLRWQTDTLNGTTAASRVTDMDFVQICWNQT